jgi:hypothetical protein
MCPQAAFYCDIAKLLSPRVLVICPPSSNADVLELIRDDLPRPVIRYERSRPPELRPQAGTVTITDILAFSRDEQDQLFDWMSRSPSTSVVAFSAEPLWPRIRAQEFRADLFYRLNVCTIDLDGQDLNQDAAVAEGNRGERR